MTQVTNLFSNIISTLNTLVQQNKDTLDTATLMQQAAKSAFQLLINQEKTAVVTQVAKLNPDFVVEGAKRSLSLFEQAAICAALETITFTVTTLHQREVSEGLLSLVRDVWVNEGAFMTPKRRNNTYQLTDAERAAARNRSEAEIMAELESAEGGCAGGACTI